MSTIQLTLSRFSLKLGRGSYIEGCEGEPKSCLMCPEDVGQPTNQPTKLPSCLCIVVTKIKGGHFTLWGTSLLAIWRAVPTLPPSLHVCGRASELMCLILVQKRTKVLEILIFTFYPCVPSL